MKWLSPGAIFPSALPTYDPCYVCGQANPSGLHIVFFAQPGGEVGADFRPCASFVGYDGVVHGGAISAFLDELTGWAVVLRTGLLACTAELQVRFAAPVHIGRLYRGTARAVEGHGRMWSAQGSLLDQEGRVCARANGRYFLLASEQTAEIAARMRWPQLASAPGGGKNG